MPNIIKNVSKAIQKGLNKSGFTLNDDRGNALNLPILPPNVGIFRTDLTNGFGAGDSPTPPGYPLVSINSKLTTTDRYEPGFTPPEAYYRYGHTSSGWFGPDGLNFEQGDIHITGGEGRGKIARTEISWNPSNASRPGNNTLSLLGQSLPDKDYNYDKSQGSAPKAKGWTDPFFYIRNESEKNTIPGLTDIPKEFGDNPKNIKPKWNRTGREIETTPEMMLKGNSTPGATSGILYGSEEVFSLFDDKQQYKFSHNRRDIDLASNVTTITPPDNEDPTMLGYDIIIKWDSSPLFNGSIPDFVSKFGGYESKSRGEIWKRFCEQFFTYFKVDQNSRISSANLQDILSGKNVSPTPIEETNDPQLKERQQIENNRENLENNNILNDQGLSTGNMAKTQLLSDVSVGGVRNGKIPKIYYLKKITGLDNLTETSVSSNQDTIKSMVEYGKDVIKLSLWEDVSLNTGKLAHLYKTLSWSRLNGKQVIPENLLRFDAKIVITEIRNFNRVIKEFDSQNINVFADETTKYTYTLYDCQFLFDNLSHGDDLDMSEKKYIDGFDISFNYKYSTLSMDSFMYAPDESNLSKRNTFIKNDQLNPLEIMADKSNSIVDGKHVINPKILNKYKTWSVGGMNSDDNSIFLGSTQSDPLNKWNSYVTSSESVIEKVKRENMTKKSLNTLGKKLTKAVATEVNRQVSIQGRLLQRTIDNIRNKFYVGRMSSPTNVYQKYFDEDKYPFAKDSRLIDDTKNAFREFIGRSVKGFFGR